MLWCYDALMLWCFDALMLYVMMIWCFNAMLVQLCDSTKLCCCQCCPVRVATGLTTSLINGIYIVVQLYDHMIMWSCDSNTAAILWSYNHMILILPVPPCGCLGARLGSFLQGALEGSTEAGGDATDVRIWGYEAMGLWGYEAVRLWGCEDMGIWNWWNLPMLLKAKSFSGVDSVGRVALVAVHLFLPQGFHNCQRLGTNDWFWFSIVWLQILQISGRLLLHAPVRTHSRGGLKSTVSYIL